MVFGRSNKEEKRVAQAQATERAAEKPNKKPVVGRDGTRHPYGSSTASAMTHPNSSVPPSSATVDHKALERAKRAADEKTAAQKVAAEIKSAAEKAVAEQAAVDKAAAEKAEKAAAEQAAAEAAAAERKAAADARDELWRSNLAKMSSSEAFDAELTSKLTSELHELRKQIEKGHRAMEATQSEISEAETDRVAAKESVTALLTSLEEERSSLLAMQRLFDDFEAELAALARGTQSATDHAALERQSTLSVRARITQELEDAYSRQRVAQQRKEQLETELEKTAAETEQAEKTADAELKHLSAAASASQLKAELAKRTALLYKVEHERMREQESALKLHATKSARAQQTAAHVSDLRAQLAADEEALAALGRREHTLGEEGLEADAKARQLALMYEAQLEAVRQLASAQERFVKQKLPGVSYGGSGAAEAELCSSTRELASAQLDRTTREIDELEQERAAASAEADAAASRRLAEAKALRAEVKAAQVAATHRRKFLEDKQAQLATEQREVAAAAKGLEGRSASVPMVQEELAAAEQACERQQLQAEAAERARRDKASAVEQLKASDRARLDVLRSQLSSETSVLAEQQRYVDSLAAKLRESALQCVEGTKADAASRGNAIVQENAEAARKAASELAERLQICSAAMEEAAQRRDVEERRGAAEAVRLAEQKAAMADALQKLAEYEQGLAANLSSLPAADNGANRPVSQAAAAPPAAARASDVVEFGAQTPRMARSTAPAAPPGNPTEVDKALAADLKSLRSSAEVASEAVRVIDQVSSRSSVAAAGA